MLAESWADQTVSSCQVDTVAGRLANLGIVSGTVSMRPLVLSIPRDLLVLYAFGGLFAVKRATGCILIDSSRSSLNRIHSTLLNSSVFTHSPRDRADQRLHMLGDLRVS